MRKLRIAIAQINPTVGNLSGNSRKILDFIHRADELQADLVSFPELALPGYPPEDLLLRPNFIAANLQALDTIVNKAKNLKVTSVIGFIDREQDIYNAAAVVHGGKIYGRYRKMHLPNYGVFDEIRYFRPGSRGSVFQVQDITLGIGICEDIWYPDGPTLEQATLGGAEVILNISASPYHAGKIQQRQRMLATRASDHTAIIAYNNLVGAQDELVFDGGSMIFDQEGEVLAMASQFEEDLLLADLDIDAVFRNRLRDPRIRQDPRLGTARNSDAIEKVLIPGRRTQQTSKPRLQNQPAKFLEHEAEVYAALVLGTRDYVLKNGFRSVVLGLSGGIDSALTACIAVDALGKGRVIGVSMPSEFTSDLSRRDASALAEILGIQLLVIPIASTAEAYAEALKGIFQGLPRDVTEENIQARIRGNLLMALSNKLGYLVLTTGNKSEMSVGYCTLYGDMAGGFAVLKDVPKTMVWALAEYRNCRDSTPPIPHSTLTRPPTAELRPDQMDTDTLPEYAVLDPILHAYVEEERSLDEIVALGYPRSLVRRIMRLVDSNEYKRRQGSPGIKITPRAFGRDRRMPITNRFRV
jgi:NAD+ synthase (glutamine-hydrolysing)